jgi:hypothetical protein
LTSAAGAELPGPLELESGLPGRKSRNQNNTGPFTSHAMGRPRTPNNLTIVLTESPVGIHRRPNVCAFLVGGLEHVAKKVFGTSDCSLGIFHFLY